MHDRGVSRSETVFELLDAFRARAKPGPGAVADSSHFPGGRDDYHLVLGFITHGNEWGTLPAALRLQEELSRGHFELAGPVTLLLGNTRAATKDVRFLEEDFNRVFTFDEPAVSWERQRADEVRPLLDSASYFLDFHQTQTPTESPFWTFPWMGDLGLWARALGGASRGLTRPGGGVFSAGKCCLDEYVRNHGGVGLTLEVGTKGPDPAQAELTYEVAARFIRALADLAAGRSDLKSLACAHPRISWFETREVVAAVTKEHRLRPGLGNWTAVSAGEILSADGAPEIRASAPGHILFPKYPGPTDPPPPELFRLGVPLEDPDAVYAHRNR